MMFLLVSSTKFAEESHEHLAEHVKGCNAGGDPDGRPDPEMIMCEGLPDDLVLRHEAGKRWDSTDGERGRKKCVVGNRHMLLKPAHLAHVLLTAHRVNHRS